jgi:hypothetical membrane protein
MDIKRISPIAGLLAPFLMFTTVFVAAALKPDFSWSDDSISSIAGRYGDSPIWSATGAPAIVLNFGFMITGTVMFFFALGLRRSNDFTSRWGRTGANLFLLPGIFLALVGVFPLTLGLIHDICSHSLFILNAISMVFMGIGLRRINKDLGLLTTLLGMGALLPFFLPRPWPGVAIPEIIAVIPTAIFVWTFTYRMLAGKEADLESMYDDQDVDDSDE